MANEMSMPLQNEMQLANWISGMFGKQANPNYRGEVAQVNQIPQMSGQDLQNLMTEYMRGNGNFLQNMMQARQAGIYNSNTQRLVANDIMAQAALKASTANTDIAKANAQLANTYQAQIQAAGPKYLPSNRGNALGALGIAGLQALLGGDKNKKKSGSKNTESATGAAGKEAGSSGNIFEQIAEMFTPAASGSTSPSAPEGYGFDPFQTPDFNPADFSDFAVDVNPSIGSESLGGFDEWGSSDLSFNFDAPAIDTYDSFTQDYGFNPGYDYQDYSEYFFD